MIADFKKKQNGLQGRFLLLLGGVVVLLIIILLIIANIKIYQKRQQLISRIQTLENKIQEVKEKNYDLKEGISNSDNDEYTERVAREELDLQKPGEKVFSFINEKESNKEENNTNKNNILKVWFKTIIDWFKK